MKTIQEMYVTILQWEHNNALCVVKLHVTVSYTQILNNNAFKVNLYHRQQLKLYIPVFERNYIPTNLHCLYTLHANAALKQKMFPFAHGLL